MKTLHLALGVLTLCGGAAWGATALPIAPQRTPMWVQVQAPTAPEGPTALTDNQLVDDIYSLLWQREYSVELMHVDITALGGRVRLQGQVGSVEEKRTIEEVATDVAGRGNVTNELYVIQR